MEDKQQKQGLLEAEVSGCQKTSREEQIENSGIIWKKKKKILNVWDQSLITFPL